MFFVFLFCVGATIAFFLVPLPLLSSRAFRCAGRFFAFRRTLYGEYALAALARPVTTRRKRGWAREIPIEILMNLREGAARPLARGGARKNGFPGLLKGAFYTILNLEGGCFVVFLCSRVASLEGGKGVKTWRALNSY